MYQLHQCAEQPQRWHECEAQMTTTCTALTPGQQWQHALWCFFFRFKLEGAQRVHMSAKWIFYSFYRGFGGRWCPVKTETLSRAVFEITGLNDIGITTLTLEGHVTSSMTSSFDLP